MLLMSMSAAGGRMVKWLSEISVAPEESQNFYHFHDNRVLPPGVDQEKAKAEGETLAESESLAVLVCVSFPSHAQWPPCCRSCR